VKKTKLELENLKVAEEFNGSVQCRICGEMFQNWEEMSSHWEERHGELEDLTEELSQIAKTNIKTLDDFKIQKAKEILLKNPKLLYEMRNSPHGKDILNKMVEGEVFKEALRIDMPSKLDFMVLSEVDSEGKIEIIKDGKRVKVPWKELTSRYAEIYKAEKRTETSPHGQHPESGMTSTEIQIPIQDETRKIMETSSKEELSKEDLAYCYRVLDTWLKSKRTKNRNR
jgi:hypothetical protein